VRRRRFAVLVGLAVLSLAVTFLARQAILSSLGRWLVRADPLVGADAIIVLAGGTPQREIEAADLYVAGLAPRILLTVERDSGGIEVLRKRGIHVETQMELKRRILLSLGVPDAGIVMLDSALATSTRMETDVVGHWVSANRPRRIIIVTSPFHTARASLMFRRALRNQQVEVLMRPTSYEAFEPHRWWTDRVQLRNGFFELQKTLFYYVAYQ
jgi:uncharacterized SAM-binding protein YcdF (DUF218 family)